MSTVNSSVARDMNRTAILAYIQAHQPVSGIAIAEDLGVEASTVSRILRVLHEESLIESRGIGSAGRRGGRRPHLWGINPEGLYFIGVEVEVASVGVVVMDLSGSIHFRQRRAVVKPIDPKTGLKLIEEMVREALDSGPADRSRIKGVGVAVPGRVNSLLGESVFAVNLDQWTHVPIGDMIETTFNIPARVEHDIRAMLHGESWFGVASSHENSIFVGLRAGIGMALMVRGRVYQGAKEFAGDVGHVVVDPAGPKCVCGRRGCLEVLAGEQAMLEAFAKSAGPEREGERPFPEHLRSHPFGRLYAALQDQNPIAIEIAKRAGWYLGREIAHLANILDPSVIVIGGSVVNHSDALFDSIRQAYRDHLTVYTEQPPEIFRSLLGDWAVAIGAACLWYRDLFTTDTPDATLVRYA